MAFNHQSSPNPKKKKKKEAQPIQFSNSCLPKQHQKVQNNSKREGKWLSRETSFFPSSLGTELEALKGDISKIKIIFLKLHDYSKGLVFFINQQIWNMSPRKNGLWQHQ
jgi:hypothetical protein